MCISEQPIRAYEEPQKNRKFYKRLLMPMTLYYLYTQCIMMFTRVDDLGVFEWKKQLSFDCKKCLMLKTTKQNRVSEVKWMIVIYGSRRRQPYKTEIGLRP